MSDEDRTYFYQRAEQELAQAVASPSAQLVSFHYQLAGLHLDRVYGADGDPRALCLEI